jgi:hypothetical protein
MQLPTLASVKSKAPLVLTLNHPPNSPVDSYQVLVAQNPPLEPGEFDPTQPGGSGVFDGGELVLDDGTFGYALGTRPRLSTRRVRTYSDTTIMLVEVRSTTARPDEPHRVYLISGGPLTLEANPGNEKEFVRARLRDPWTYIESVEDANGNVHLGPPVPASEWSPEVRKFVDAVLDLAVREIEGHQRPQPPW